MFEQELFISLMYAIKVEQSEKTSKKRENLLKFNMMDFDFLVDFLKHSESLEL